MLLTDYHSHTALSPDGKVSLAEMAAAARAAGLAELCVTDHCDLLDENGRPAPSWDWAPHLAQLEEARADCGDRGPALRLGLELGVPHVNPEAAAQICALPQLDFVIGSIHNLSRNRGGIDFFFVDYPDERSCHAALDDYFSSMEALVRTDFYDVLGHIIYPLRYMPFPITLDPWRDRIRAILEEAVSRGRGMEVNTYRGRTLEAWREILELYRDCGGEIVTVGSDAHIPAHVGKGIPQALELVKACGFAASATYEKHVPIFHTI